MPRAQTLRRGIPSWAGTERLRSVVPPKNGQHGVSAGRRTGGFAGFFSVGCVTGTVSNVSMLTPVGATSPPADGVRAARYRAAPPPANARRTTTAATATTLLRRPDQPLGRQAMSWTTLASTCDGTSYSTLGR